MAGGGGDTGGTSRRSGDGAAAAGGAVCVEADVALRGTAAVSHTADTGGTGVGETAAAPAASGRRMPATWCTSITARPDDAGIAAGRGYARVHAAPTVTAAPNRNARGSAMPGEAAHAARGDGAGDGRPSTSSST